MPLEPWGPYRPDVSDYQGKHSRSVKNCLPQGDGYGPMPQNIPYGDSLPSDCRGGFVAYALDGTVEIFAGTATNLYQFNKTDLSWDEVSKSTGVYSMPTDDMWSFAQLGNIVIAAHINDLLQTFTIGTSSQFADQAGSPQAKQVTVINEFVVCSGISGALNRVKWSARSDITGWTAGVSDSDQEDFIDGGIVKRVEGGEFSGLVLQDQDIHRMVYSPGADVVFSFDRIQKNGGLRVDNMVASDDARTFYLSHRGFQMILAGSNEPVSIGKEQTDRFFFGDWDSSEPRTSMAAIDPGSTRVFFTYFSVSGETTKFDRMLVYDWVLERWARITGISGRVLFPFSQPGTTLEGLDSQFPSVDDMTLSFDDIPLSQSPELGVIDNDSKLGFFRGDNLEAEFVSAEASGEHNHISVNGFRPITDAATVFGQVGFREKPSDTQQYVDETQMNDQGFVPSRASNRLLRFRARIPAGTTWTWSMGVEPEVIKAGKR